MIINYNKRSKKEKEEIELILSEEFDSMYNLKISDASLSSSRYDILITISRVSMRLLSLIGMKDIKETYNNDSINILFANKLMMRQNINFKIIEAKKVDKMNHYSYFGLFHNNEDITKTFHTWKELKDMIQETEDEKSVFYINREMEEEYEN